MLNMIENIDLIQDWLQMMIFIMLCTWWKCGADLKKCDWLTDFRAKSRDPLGMKITLLNESLSGWRYQFWWWRMFLELPHLIEDFLLLDQLDPQQLLQGPHLQSRRTWRKRKFLKLQREFLFSQVWLYCYYFPWQKMETLTCFFRTFSSNSAWTVSNIGPIHGRQSKGILNMDK